MSSNITIYDSTGNPVIVSGDEAKDLLSHLTDTDDPHNVVESGSNANGNWVKYADGTMICSVEMVVTDQAIDSSYSDIYIGSRPWTFPLAFVEAYVAVCGQFKWGSSASWGSIAYQPGTTEVWLRGYDYVSRAAGTDTYISAMAIGRWK